MLGFTHITEGQRSPETKKVSAQSPTYGWKLGLESILHNLKTIFQMFPETYNIDQRCKVFMWYINWLKAKEHEKNPCQFWKYWLRWCSQLSGIRQNGLLHCLTSFTVNIPIELPFVLHNQKGILKYRMIYAQIPPLCVLWVLVLRKNVWLQIWLNKWIPRKNIYKMVYNVLRSA